MVDVNLAPTRSQLPVEIPLDVNLQKAWEQSRLDHLFERFGKPLIVVPGQKNDPPSIQRLRFRTARCMLDVKQRLVMAGVKMLTVVVCHFSTAEGQNPAVVAVDENIFEHLTSLTADPCGLDRRPEEPFTTLFEVMASPRASV